MPTFGSVLAPPRGVRVGEHFTDVTVARRAVTAYCDNSPTTGAAESA